MYIYFILFLGYTHFVYTKLFGHCNRIDVIKMVLCLSFGKRTLWNQLLHWHSTFHKQWRSTFHKSYYHTVELLFVTWNTMLSHILQFMFSGFCVKYFELNIETTNSPSEWQNQIGACNIQECRTLCSILLCTYEYNYGIWCFFSFSRSWEVAKYSSEIWDLMVLCSFSRSREVAKHSSEPI